MRNGCQKQQSVAKVRRPEQMPSATYMKNVEMHLDCKPLLDANENNFPRESVFMVWRKNFGEKREEASKKWCRDQMAVHHNSAAGWG